MAGTANYRFSEKFYDSALFLETIKLGQTFKFWKPCMTLFRQYLKRNPDSIQQPKVKFLQEYKF